MPSQTPITWSGQFDFDIVGTERDEDTLRATCNHPDPELTLRLTLPTLAITYAELSFSNSIGGVQANYPTSQVYGPRFFDPPVVLTGADIEHVTWIRGASQVEIGPSLVHIDWSALQQLVVPRLRLGEVERSPATVEVNAARIPVDRPLQIDLEQLADGRAIGGLRLEKRHPDWTPPPVDSEYDWWVKVIDGRTGDALSDVRVILTTFEPYGSQVLHTGDDGVATAEHRPSGLVEAVNLALPGWHAHPRAYRAFPGQSVRTRLEAWQLEEATLPWTWRDGDDLEDLAALGGHREEDVLALNGIKSANDLEYGRQIELPCYQAAWFQDTRDIDEVAALFGYTDVAELAEATGVADPTTAPMIDLPGWRFLYATGGLRLSWLEERLTGALCRLIGICHHPDPDQPFEHETIAVRVG